MKMNGRRAGALLLISGLSVCMLAAPAGMRAQEIDASLFERGEVLTGDALLPVAADGTRELQVNPATGEIRLKDTALGQTLCSYPEEKEGEETTSGYNAAGLRSALIIQYINTAKVMAETNSLIASVRKGGLTVHRTASGAVFTYVMPDLGITIPVACVLREGALEVSILTGEIREEKDYMLLECTLMPYLGSAGPQETGYLLVPDGSGALLDFSPESKALPSFQYKEPVYGRDPMGSVLSKSSNSEEIKLPVFAIKTGERTVMGMITEGDALSSIEVFAKGSKTAQSTVHPVMTYRGTFTRTLFDASWEKKKTIIVAENAAEIPAFTVRYTLFGEGGYNEVAERTAACYRQQTDGQTARAADAALTLQVLGAVRKPGSVLGVPVQAVYAATTYTQTASLVRRLREEGTPGLHVVYQGMFAGGLYDKMPVKAKTESARGSRKELAALCELLAEDGSWLFPAADLSGIYTSGYGVSYKGDAARDFAGGVKEIVPFSPVTFAPQEDGLSYTLLTPRRTTEVYASFTAALNTLGLHAFADSGAGRLPSDNHRTFFGSKRFVDRQAAKEIQRAAVQQAASGLEAYMTDYAAGYLLPYASYVTNVPACSSRGDGFTREIPFYSLVASPFVQLAARPVNFEEDPQTYLLRCIEYGLLPGAIVSGEGTDALGDTAANWLYAADPDAVCDWMAELVDRHEAILAVIGGSALTAHEPIAAGVYKSRFAGGQTVWVNYTDAAVEVDGVTVPATGYRIGGAA